MVHLHADSLGRLLRVDLGGLVSGQRRVRATASLVPSRQLLGEVCPPVMVTTHPTASTASPPP